MPSEPNFFEGEVVEYRGRKGTICFVDPMYISLCVSETVQPDNIHKSCQNFLESKGYYENKILK